MNHLPGYVTCIVGKQKAGNTCDLVGLSKTAERNLFENLCPVGFIEGVLLHDLLTPLTGQSTGRTLLERWNREGRLEGDKPARLLSQLITHGVLCAPGIQTTERPGFIGSPQISGESRSLE